MTASRLSGILAIALLPAGSARAQEPASDGSARTGEGRFATVAATIANVINAEGTLHPIVQMVPAGGSLGIGLDYDPSFRPGWYTRALTMVTIRRAWSAEFGAGYRAPRARGEVYGRMRDLPRLGYFGPGPHSSPADRTTYRLRDPMLGATGRVQINAWLSLGGRAEVSWPEVARGRSSSVPALQEVFDEIQAPGLTAQPRMGRYEVLARIDVPAAPGEVLQQGGVYRAAYATFRDHQFGRFTFRRLELEGQHQLALRPQHRLTLHAWMSTSEPASGQSVPFYLQRTLGGRALVRTVQSDVLGLDSRPAALGGFSSLRFRDRHLLLVQAEYRVPVWGPLELSAFTEAGTVAARPSDVSWSTMKRSHGVGVSLRRGPGTALRVEAGFGGGEGTHVWVSTGVHVLP